MKTNLTSSEIREKMDKLFNQFIQDNGEEPNYANCMVQFQDNNSSLEVTIKLSCDVVEKEDDEIFYYCDGLDDLKHLTDKGQGEDFIIADFFEFE